MNKRSDKDVNMITDGVVWKGILYFFFPILFGTFFQQLYNTVDAIIVGQFLGKEALAAVGGGTSTIINLLIGFFTGLASGASVVISQHYGARQKERVQKSIHTAMALAILCGIFITVVGYLSAEWSLKLIGTPEEIMPMSIEYMHIYYTGSLTLVIYNMGSGIFRSFGDSRRPLYFLVAGCVTNIILDLLFVAVMHMGVAGAAYATVASQFVSMLLTVIFLMREKDEKQLHLANIRFELSGLKSMLAIGVPAGIQSVMYTLSNLIIQSNINSFGTDTAAAWAAYGKIDSMYWMLVNAFGLAVTTFTGQNYGAHKFDRIHQGVKESIVMSSTVTVCVSAIYYFFGEFFYRLFTTDENVIAIGMGILRFIAPLYITYLFIELLSGTIRGAGKALVPTIICIAGVCGLRIIWLFCVAPFHHTLQTVIACYPITWIATGLMFIGYYTHLRRSGFF